MPRAILEGEPAATPIIVKDIAYTIRVRYPETNRSSLEAMSNTLLNSASGHTATLGSLATVTELPGQTEIRRENLQRDVAVTARLEGPTSAARSRRCRRLLLDLHLPSSIRVEYGGTYAEQQKSFHDLMLVLVLARCAGVCGAALRVPHACRAALDSGVGAAVHLGRISCAADHAAPRSTSRRSWA